MKKTIASVAILVSASSAMAMIVPGNPGRTKMTTACLNVYDAGHKDGSKNAGDCDDSRNNLRRNLKIQENGCAEGQVAIQSVGKVIRACMPAGAAQL